MFAGVHQDTFVLINSTRPSSVLGLGDLVPLLRPQWLATIAATAMAVRVIGRPLPNAILLVALVALSGMVPIDALRVGAQSITFCPADTKRVVVLDGAITTGGEGFRKDGARRHRLPSAG